MDDDTTQAAQHHADMLAFQKQAQEALCAAHFRPLTPDEISALAWCAGIQQQEIRL